MTGAMYSAIAGLKTHMQNLNVIGNNVANVNTMGYKTARSVFQTALFTSMRSGSAGTTTVGGTNPSQIGYGSNLGSVDMSMGTSTYAATGNPTDCMIDGDGFFMVGTKDIATAIKANDPTTLKSLTLTRVGDIEFKADGYLSNHNGDVVYGFMCTGMAEDGTPIISDQLVPIRYPKAEKVETEEDILDEDGQPTGEKRTIVTTEIRYAVVNPVDGVDGATTLLTDAVRTTGEGENAVTEELPFAEFDSVSIDEKTGKITGTVKDTDLTITIGFIALGTVTNPNGVTQMTGTYYKAGEAAGDLSVSMMGGAASDVYNAANYDPTSTTNTKGITYVNGSRYPIDFAAANGADAELPDTLPDKMAIGSGGSTGLLTSGLEQSNVDLATEISQMILTQRGYQANTRIITVTDSMLEELVNMKR